MIALDTNVLVRTFTRDDPEQARAARQVMGSGPLWISKSVLLETEWVLRFSYDAAPLEIGRAYRMLLGVPSVDVEDRPSVLHALQWYDRGMDFADALHLASRGGADRFVTFDRKLATVAERIPECDVAVQLLGGREEYV